MYMHCMLRNDDGLEIQRKQANTHTHTLMHTHTDLYKERGSGVDLCLVHLPRFTSS